MDAHSDVAALMQWDLDAPIAPETYARMRAHPRFAAAVRRFTGNMIAACEADAGVDGLLKDAGRSVAGLCAAYLHASGGVTLPRLKALFARFRLVSPGRARALLLYLAYLGYVELMPVREQGKPLLYTPTARFLHIYREHMRAVVDAVAVLEPAAGLVRDGFDAPGVFESFVVHTADGFIEGQQAGHDYDAYYHVFMHRYAGLQIVHALVAEAEGDVFPPEGPMAFSMPAAARRFRVSRMHLRRMMEAGEREGFVRLEESTISFTPAGRDAVEWAYASQMITFLAGAARALKDHPELLQRPGAERVA
jgi:hypothetical protein